MRPVRRLAVVCVVVLATGVSAFAASGWVVDESGEPIAGAQACYRYDTAADALCDTTGEDGYFVLPQSRISSVVVRATGYLPVEIAAVEQDVPVVLERAAAFFVRLYDASTREPLPEGRIWVVTSTGARRGPFPVNRVGLRMRSFPPGEFRVDAEAPGYTGTTGTEMILEAGEETVVEVSLKPSRPAGP